MTGIILKMALQNRALVLAERPDGEIIPDRTFRNEYTDAPLSKNLKDGEIIVENLCLSIDPAMRAWLNGKCFQRLVCQANRL